MCVRGYLLAVHHVPEAGERVDPDVHVLVLNGPHGQLQRCGQVAAAHRQLQRSERRLRTGSKGWIPSESFTSNVINSS